MLQELTDGDKKALSDIEKYGLHIVYVLADEEGPGFGFSIGLFRNFKHPEIVVVGLKQGLTHSIINDMADDIKGGKSFFSNKYYSNILEGFDCYFANVDITNYKEYLGYALWFYNGDNFPTVQCIYSTTKGIYPWEKEWPQNTLQPILGSIKG
jgi:hypothetical protein